MADQIHAAPPKRAELQSQFHEYFQGQNEAIQKQISRLAEIGAVGGERTDAIEHCLASIARLSDQVGNATSYIAPYDQRTYSDGVKSLTAKLNETRAAVAPKPKFSFRSKKKNESALSMQDVEAAAVQSGREAGVEGGRSTASETETGSGGPSVAASLAPSPPSEVEGKGVDEMSTFSTNSLLSALDGGKASVSNHSSRHIIVSPSAEHNFTSGTVNSIKQCIIDMSGRSGDERAFASLMLKDVKESLIICGNVDGPIHTTNIENSIIVGSCRQFRMHGSKRCDVYLQCGSNPIIEDCHAIRFSPLPDAFKRPAEHSAVNKWDQVDDFKWLKAEQSPNWEIMSSDARIEEEKWSTLVLGQPSMGTAKTLAALGISIAE